MSAAARHAGAAGARRKVVRIQASWTSLPPLIGRKRDRDAMAGDGARSDDEMDIEAQAHVTDSESVHSVGSSFGGVEDADEDDDMDIDAGMTSSSREPSLSLGGGLGVTREIDRALGIFRAAVHGAPSRESDGGRAHSATDAGGERARREGRAERVRDLARRRLAFAVIRRHVGCDGGVFGEPGVAGRDRALAVGGGPRARQH